MCNFAPQTGKGPPVNISGPAVCAAAGSKVRTCLDVLIAPPVTCNVTPVLSTAPPVLCNATHGLSSAPQVLSSAPPVLCNATHDPSSAPPVLSAAPPVLCNAAPVLCKRVFFGFPQPQKVKTSDLNPSKITPIIKSTIIIHNIKFNNYFWCQA